MSSLLWVCSVREGDLADHKDFFRTALEPAAHASRLGELLLIDSNKTFFLFAQGDPPLVLECGNEMPALGETLFEVQPLTCLPLDTNDGCNVCLPCA